MDPRSLTFTCGSCGVKEPNMNHCTGCFSITYCSKACQTKARPKHEDYCVKKLKAFRNLNAICQYCGQITSDFQEKRECPGCSHTVYCSRTCLAKDWVKHKTDCLCIEKPEDCTKQCKMCSSKENVRTCSKCKAAHYCSKECQKKDWKIHKDECITPSMKYKIDVEEKLREMRMLEIRYLNHIQRSGIPYTKLRKDEDFSVNLYDDFADLTIFKRPNENQWTNIKLKVRTIFPSNEIITRFQLLTKPSREKTLLIAFIPRYHNYRGRHCVYLEDDTETELYAAFYFKINDFPNFSWSEIKPGRFIIIESPKLHTFRDHTTGFRFDDPSKLTFIDPDMELLYSRTD